MTKKERIKHIEDINKMLTEVCGDVDRWGHYKIGEYRVKMQKTSLRLEKKPEGFGRWMKCSSSYFKDVNVGTLRCQMVAIKERIK